MGPNGFAFVWYNLQPSNETFSVMMHDISTGKENKDGADQGFLVNHFNDLLDKPMFYPPGDGTRLNGLFRLPLGYLYAHPVVFMMVGGSE
jgi:hypothetical protein